VLFVSFVVKQTLQTTSEDFMKEVRGVVLPSPTVFRADGSVDEPLMRELTDWFVACGVHAFFILGSYGQGAAMNPEERKKVAEIIVQQVKHRVPVVVHIGAVDPYTPLNWASMPKRSAPKRSVMSGHTITPTAPSTRSSSI
jgi:hypothetical protein